SSISASASSLEDQATSTPGAGLSNPKVSQGRRHMLDLVNCLHSTGIQVDIEFPQIAVIGSLKVLESPLSSRVFLKLPYRALLAPALGPIASQAGGSGDSNDIDLVQHLVTTYIKKPNCITLLTVACETDFALNRFLQLRMPEIFKELDANIKSCRKSVQQLPRPLPDNPQSEIATLVYNFVSDLEKYVEGVSDEDGLLLAIHPAQERFKRAVCTTAPKLRPFERKYEGERHISRAHFLVEDGRVCNDEQNDYEDENEGEDDGEEEDPQNDNSTHECSVRSPAKRKSYPTNKIYIDEVMGRANR
ncbi:hypothetical protein CVT25_008012, partial [Psilocybe cyanescens]